MMSAEVSVSEPRRLRPITCNIGCNEEHTVPAYVLLKATMNARDCLHLASYVCDGRSLVQHIHKTL